MGSSSAGFAREDQTGGGGRLLGAGNAAALPDPASVPRRVGGAWRPFTPAEPDTGTGGRTRSRGFADSIPGRNARDGRRAAGIQSGHLLRRLPAADDRV